MVKWSVARKLSWRVLLAALPVAAYADCDKVIVSADPDYPPLHWHDSQRLQGPSIELAARVLSDLQIPFEVRYVGPWKRVLANAAVGQVDLVATLKLQPERERYLEFVRTPAFPNPVAVFVPRQHTFLFNSWGDLKSRKGGIALGNRFGPDFEEFAASHLRLEEAGTAETNFRKLAAGRIDYFVTGLFTGETYLATHQLSEQFVAMRPFVTEDKNYFAFSRSSPCQKYHDAFEARLKDLVAAKVNLALLNASLNSLDVKLDSTTLSRK